MALRSLFAAILSSWKLVFGQSADEALILLCWKRDVTMEETIERRINAENFAVNGTYSNELTIYYAVNGTYPNELTIYYAANGTYPNELTIYYAVNGIYPNELTKKKKRAVRHRKKAGKL